MLLLELRAFRFTDTLVNEVSSNTIANQGEKQVNNNGAEQAGRGTKAPNQAALPSSAGARTTRDQLSQAVGRYALTQSQIDAKVASHLIEISVEVQSLGARVEKLERALAPRKKATRAHA